MRNLSLLLQDIFTFLSFVDAHDVRLRGPHSLTPNAIQSINALFSVRDRLDPERARDQQGHWKKSAPTKKSERYTTRLRFIHYLCESANLVAPSAHQLVSTLHAATYLAQNHSTQARRLFQTAFPTQPAPAQRERWRKFQLPDHPVGEPQSFAQWLAQILRELPPDQTIKLDTLLKLYRDAARAQQFIPIESDDPADAPENLIRAHLELVQFFDVITLHTHTCTVTPLGAALLHDTPFPLDADTQPAEPLCWTRSHKTDTLPDLIATARADTRQLLQLTVLAEHAATLAAL